MTAPLPPVVNGSVYAVPNVQISADNVLPDALVAVFQNGSEVGRPPRPNPGMFWVPTTVALTIGGKIAATQTYTGTRATCRQHPACPASPRPCRSPCGR